jgi:hypothetical protein
MRRILYPLGEFVKWRTAHMPKKPELSDDDVALRAAFGERVRIARESLGLKPQEFAAFGGISMAHQYRIEAGERTAEVLYVQRLAARFGALIVGVLFGMALPSSSTSPAEISLSNSGAGAVQVGRAGGKVKVRKG